MCPEWDFSFEKFYEAMGPRPPGTTLERADNSKGYVPGNCVWATKTQQARNRRGNKLLTFKEETLPAAALAEKYGVSLGALYARLAHGWSTVRALTTPVRKYRIK